jgi:hypothetical protein
MKNVGAKYHNPRLPPGTPPPYHATEGEGHSYRGGYSNWDRVPGASLLVLKVGIGEGLEID